MFRKVTFVFGLLALAAWPLKAQEITDVRQIDKSIVVEYDLEQDAKTVRLFLSKDGGKTYQGPLKRVKGDMDNVQSGDGKCITWDVLKEVDSLVSDAVRFKLKVEYNEKWYNGLFVTANVAYSIAPQASFGLSIGQVKHFGWFVSVMTNANFECFDNYAECDGDGYIDGGYLLSYNGNTRTSRLSVMGGGIMHVDGPLYVRLGLGYGCRFLCWETNDNKWVKNSDYSFEGIDVSGGVQAHFGKVVASLEAVTTNFQTFECKFGIGYIFK